MKATSLAMDVSGLLNGDFVGKAAVTDVMLHKLYPPPGRLDGSG